MIYTLPSLGAINTSLYSAHNSDEATYSESPGEIPGLFGELYITQSLPLPWQWNLLAHQTGRPEDLADYLLENRVNVDPEIANAINDYFWDF